MRLLMLPLLLAACTGAPDPEPTGAMPDRTPAETTGVTAPDSVVAITGVVRHFDLEGGFFAIQDLQFDFGPAQVVPEPATLALTASGFLLLGGVGLRRRRR